jgi:sulfane dehydrogenase subunit SoxC
MFLTAGTAAAAAVAGAALPDLAVAAGLPVEPWMKLPGAGFADYGQPSKFESKVAADICVAARDHWDRRGAHAASFARRHDYA